MADINSLIKTISDEVGLPFAFLQGLQQQENPKGDPLAVNKNLNGTTDHGLFQINSGNVPALKAAGIISTIEDLNVPEKNAAAAAFMLKDLKRQGATTPEQFAAGYNTGNIKNITHPYVAKVLARVQNFTKAASASETAATAEAPAATLEDNTSLIMETLGAVRTGIANARTALTGAADSVAKGGADYISMIKDFTTVLEKSIAGNSAITMQREGQNKGIAAAFGLDPAASDAIISGLAVKIRGEADAHAVKLDRLNKLREVSVFDDPVAWLGAQLNIPQAAAQANTHARNHAAATAQLSNAISLTTAAVTANNASSATTNAEQARLQAQVEVFKVLEVAHRTKLINDKEHAALIAQAATLPIHELNAITSIEKMREGNLTREILRANQAFAADAKAEQLAEQLTIADTASEVFGTKITPARIKGSRPDIKQILTLAGVTGKLGANVMEAIKNKQLLGENPAANAGVMRALRIAEDQIPAAILRPEYLKATGNIAKNDEVKRVIESHFTTMSQDATIGGSENPYLGPSAAALLGSNAPLQAKLPLLMPLLRPFIDTGQAVSPNALMETIVKQLSAPSASGGVPANMTNNLVQFEAELQTYFKAVVANNNDTYRFHMLGLPVQEDYKAKIDGIVTNLTSGAELSRGMMMKMTKVFAQVLEEQLIGNQRAAAIETQKRTVEGAYGGR